MEKNKPGGSDVFLVCGFRRRDNNREFKQITSAGDATAIMVEERRRCPPKFNFKQREVQIVRLRDFKTIKRSFRTFKNSKWSRSKKQGILFYFAMTKALLTTKNSWFSTNSTSLQA